MPGAAKNPVAAADNTGKRSNSPSDPSCANSAPKAAFKLVEIMESNKPIIQANNKITAAQTLLDRVGVAKIDRVDVNHNVNSGGIFLMPDKAPLDIEDGDYEDISD